ncbi:MAG: hypothetical protein NWF01_11575 [Candidatus Bathyarchaeota archaeon]|nr:hypothetical protein [Candidatus Bathyarchaeota archaeon]
MPCLTVNAQPKNTPHEDPDASQSTIDAYTFLVQYAQVFALMSNRDYTNASILSEEITHISIPPDLSYIINRYNNMTQQLINTLKDLQNTLDKASTLLDQYRLTESKQVLDQAAILVAQAQILISDLESATTTLSQRLGVFAASAQDKAKQAYNQLQNMLQQLKYLIDRYHKLLQEANQKVKEIETENLKQTTLSLTLNTTKCFVGEYLKATGKLTTQGSILANRDLNLFLDDYKVAETKTLEDGTYSVIIKMPYKYVNSVSINAVYTPSGSDVGVYLAALSSTITVQVQYYKTVLEISAPNTVRPGTTITVKGNITTEDGTTPNQRQITIYLDSNKVNQVKSSQNGTFETKVTIDPQTTLGTHTLEGTVDPTGRYDGTSVQKMLTVQEISTNLKIHAPSFVVLPSQMQVSGTVESSSQPLQGTTVLIQFGNTSVSTKTSNDGRFNYTINMPLSTFLAGYQELTVQAQPTEPWQATAQAKTSVFVLSSISIGLAVLCSSTVFLLSFLKFTKTNNKNKKTINETATTSLPQNTPSPPTTTTIQLKISGNQGAVLEAYIEALNRVQQKTGEQLMSDMTLREYLQKTQLKIFKAAGPFGKLTMIAERSLYSPYQPQPEDIEKAQNWVDEIRREINATA